MANEKLLKNFSYQRNIDYNYEAVLITRILKCLRFEKQTEYASDGVVMAQLKYCYYATGV